MINLICRRLILLNNNLLDSTLLFFFILFKLFFLQNFIPNSTFQLQVLQQLTLLNSVIQFASIWLCIYKDIFFKLRAIITQ